MQAQARHCTGAGAVMLIRIVPPLGYFMHIPKTTACRLRLEKLLYLQLSRSHSGCFKPLLDPGSSSTSETVVKRFQKRNYRYETVSEVKRLQIYNGYKTSQWLRLRIDFDPFVPTRHVCIVYTYRYNRTEIKPGIINTLTPE
jgi:hypothetical protein